jgi:hypothetical protein
MSKVVVEVRVDLLVDDDLQELDEAALASRLAEGDTAGLREARALDGALRMGSSEIADELFSAVQRLCFEAAPALLTDGVVVEYRYFSSNESLRLVAADDSVVISGSDVPGSTFPRRELLVALYACGARWLATLDQLGRAAEANHLRPFAAAAHAALAAAGLA